MPEDLRLFLREQLTEQIDLADLQFPDLNGAQENIIPFWRDGSPWKTYVQWTQFSTVGIATVLASQANDGGKVGIIAARRRTFRKTLSDYTEVDYETLQQAQVGGVDIEGRHGVALVYGMDKKHNSIIFDGDPEYGLYGLLTCGLPRVNAASVFASAANPEGLLALLNAPFAAIAVATNTQGIKNKVITLPTRQHQLIGNTYFGAAAPGVTVKQAFINAQSSLGVSVTFIEDNNLVGKGTGGTDVMLITPRPTTGDAKNAPIFYDCPMQFDLPPDLAQVIDMIYRERAIGRSGGVIANDPLQGLIVEGI